MQIRLSCCNNFISLFIIPIPAVLLTFNYVINYSFVCI